MNISSEILKTKEKFNSILTIYFENLEKSENNYQELEKELFINLSILFSENNFKNNQKFIEGFLKLLERDYEFLNNLENKDNIKIKKIIDIMKEIKLILSKI